MWTTGFKYSCRKRGSSTNQNWMETSRADCNLCSTGSKMACQVVSSPQTITTLSTATQVSQYQNDTIPDFIGARMMEVVVTTGATRCAKSSHNIETPNSLQAGCPSCRSTNSVRAGRMYHTLWTCLP